MYVTDKEINIITITLMSFIAKIVEDTVDWAKVKEEDTDDDNDG